MIKYANYHWEQLQNVFIDQALSQVLTEKQKCCSMSELEFANFYKPYMQQSEKLNIDLDELLHGDFKNFEKSKKKTTPEKIAKHITTDIRKALSTSEPIVALAQLLDSQSIESTKRLVHWVHDLAISGELQQSSIERYMDAVAHPWLIKTFEDDINDYDDQEYEAIYQDIIDAKTGLGAVNDGWLLNRFHQFQVKEYKAPDVSLNIANSRQICSASVLSPEVFQAMCVSIQHSEGLNPYNKRTYILLLILAYRTGMRRGEITGLQFKDVEWGEKNKVRELDHKHHDSEFGDPLSFIIRSNKVRKVKTSSAYRRIPVGALLKPDEVKQLRSYLNDSWDACNKSKVAAVFSLADSQAPLPKNSPSVLFKKAIDHVLLSHKYHDYSFHSLRHTTISNLSLILLARPELAEHLTDYTNEDCQRIRHALLGIHHQGQDRWFGLAQVAGHLNPDHSFQHYIHFAHLMGGYEICQGNLEMPFAALQNITGHTKHQLFAKTPDAIDPNTKKVTLRKIRPLLESDLASSTGRWEDLWQIPQDNQIKKVVESKTVVNNLEKEQNVADSFILPGSVSSQITMQTVHTILSKIESGRQVEEIVSGYLVDVDEVNQWVERAQKLAELPTEKGVSRLFPSTRKRNAANLQLVPAKLKSPKEQLLVAEFFMNMCSVHKNNREGLHLFLDIFLRKVSTTKHEIQFPLNQEQKLADFLKIGEQIINIKRWRLRTKTLDDASALKKRLNLNTSLPISETGLEPLSKLDVEKKTQPIKYKGYSLSIVHPKEENFLNETSPNKRASSGLLKYICHMIAITDLSYVIKTSH